MRLAIESNRMADRSVIEALLDALREAEENLATIGQDVSIARQRLKDRIVTVEDELQGY